MPLRLQNTFSFWATVNSGWWKLLKLMLLLSQIWGALTRRICGYWKEADQVGSGYYLDACSLVGALVVVDFLWGSRYCSSCSFLTACFNLWGFGRRCTGGIALWAGLVFIRHISIFAICRLQIWMKFTSLLLLPCCIKLLHWIHDFWGLGKYIYIFKYVAVHEVMMWLLYIVIPGLFSFWRLSAITVYGEYK